MIGREDREDALLKSALQADERVRVVSEHFTECLMLLEEAPNPEDKELVEGDVPLPPVTVPVFAGDYADWPAFEDLYSSVVHTRTDITPAYKMAQLMSRLHGEPHELLTHLAVSDSNYEVAWKILTDRYRNKRLIVDRLLDQWLSIPTITRGTDLREKIFHPVSVAVSALERQGLPVAGYGYILVHTVLRRLPSEMVARFEQLHGARDLCPRHPERPGAPARGGNSGQPRRYNTALESGCAYCKETGHGVAACQEFAAQRVQRRRGVAQQRRWCFRCLGPHQVRECPSSTNCRYCQGAHHPLLCMNRSGGAGAALDRISEGACPPREGATLPPLQGGAHLRIGHRDRQGDVNRRSPLTQGRGDDPHHGSRCRIGEERHRNVARTPIPGTGFNGRVPGSTRQPPGYMQYSAGLSHLVGSQDPRMPPPMPEYPRLQAQPRYGRLPSGYYRTPAMAFMGRPPYQQEWDPYTVWRPQDLPEGDPVLYGSVLSEVLQRFWESEEPPTADRRKPEDDECELFYQYNTARCPSGRFEWPFNECRAPLGPPDRGLRVNVGQLVPKPNPAFLLERYSSLDKLLGVTGWIKRFVNNCRKPQAERNFTPVLSPAERNAALCSLVRVVQAEHFEEELSACGFTGGIYLFGLIKKFKKYCNEADCIKDHELEVEFDYSTTDGATT
ncbi:hypothetical protein NE865_02587 [Phthorimaea operculella]|nr:hypothetical protein NE865_02587 [Phthorimaea operculella]